MSGGVVLGILGWLARRALDAALAAEAPQKGADGIVQR